MEMDLPQIDNYPVTFDRASALLTELGDDVTYAEPRYLCTFVNPAHAVHYYLDHVRQDGGK